MDAAAREELAAVEPRPTEVRVRNCSARKFKQGPSEHETYTSSKYTTNHFSAQALQAGRGGGPGALAPLRGISAGREVLPAPRLTEEADPWAGLPEKVGGARHIDVVSLRSSAYSRALP